MDKCRVKKAARKCGLGWKTATGAANPGMSDVVMCGVNCFVFQNYFIIMVDKFSI